MARKGYTRFVLTGVHAGKTIDLGGGRYRFVDGSLELLSSNLKPGTFNVLRSFGAVPETELAGLGQGQENGDGSGEVQEGGDNALGGEEVDDEGPGEGSGDASDEDPVVIQPDAPTQAGTEEHVPEPADRQGASALRRRRR